MTSILLELGARRDLVAVSRWCKEVADVRGLPTFGDCWKIDTKPLARLRPTLIIGSVPYRAEALAALLEYPAPFVATNPRTLADIFAEIEMLGALTGRQAAARKLVARMQTAFGRVSRAARRVGHKSRVYAESWPNPRISSPPWVAELVEIAGGKMAVPSGRRVSDDEVRRALPEVMILAWAATGDRSRPETALSNPAWRNVPAVETGRVFVVPDHLLNTPGPPLVRGLLVLFEMLHPELATRNSRR
ncbi:MAG: ABC transporter substrate-binding protein [Acidobacteriota bacterium]|nr:ABC transporter substrate-binding protein [Acidobacteriota bacterium]